MLTCGGTALTNAGLEAIEAGPAQAQQNAALQGKQYPGEASGLEVLCMTHGFGELTFAGRSLTIRQAKAPRFESIDDNSSERFAIA